MFLAVASAWRRQVYAQWLSPQVQIESHPIAGAVGYHRDPMASSHAPSQPTRFFYGWIIVVVVAMGGFAASTEAFPVLSIFLKPITEEFGWSRSTFTMPLTIGGILGSVAALLTGPIVDRYGSRWALAAAYGLLGVAFSLIALMENQWQYYGIQIVARSMNTGVITVAAAVIIPNWFITKRGKAISLSNIGFPIGASLMPLYVQLLVSIWGWREAALGVGVMILVISALPSAFFIRRRPEDQGLFPDGDLRDSRDDQHGRTRPSGIQDVSLTLSQAMRKTSFYLLTIAGVFWWFGRAGLVLHAVPYLTDSGVSDGVAVSALVVHSAAGGGGVLLAGFLGDRFSVRYLLAIDFGMTAAGTALLLTVGPPWLALGWGLFYGFAQGASVPLQRLMFADYFGRRHLGSIEGVVRAVQNVAQATGPLVAALVFDATESYRLIFGVFVFTNVAAASLVILARHPLSSRRAWGATRERPR